MIGIWYQYHYQVSIYPIFNLIIEGQGTIPTYHQRGGPPNAQAAFLRLGPWGWLKTIIYIYTYVCMHACMYVYMYACMYVCMFVCLSVCLSVCLFVCLYIHICLSVYTHLFGCASHLVSGYHDIYSYLSIRRSRPNFMTVYPQWPPNFIISAIKRWCMWYSYHAGNNHLNIVMTYR